MPRGVRRDAAPAAPRKRGPKPGAKRVLVDAGVGLAVAVAQAAAAAPLPAQAQPEAAPAVESRDSLQRGRNIDTMPEVELRRYARQLGITQRDAEGLSVERLRQNCTAQLYELIDAL